MKFKLLEWCGSKIGVTVGKFYTINPDNHTQFIDDNGDARPLSMAKYERHQWTEKAEVKRETFEMKTKR